MKRILQPPDKSYSPLVKAQGKINAESNESPR